MESKTNATRIPDKEWEARKEMLHKLYIDDNRTVTEIVDYMKKQQFNAA